MEAYPHTTGKPRQTDNPISIEDYLRELAHRRRHILDGRLPAKASIPLTYEQFCQLTIAHGSNYFAERGEDTLFRIDDDNTNAIRQLYLYLTAHPAFCGDPCKGILLNGKYGSGKTALMQALMRTYNDCIKHASRQGVRLTPMRLFKSSDIVEAFRRETCANTPGYGFPEERQNIDLIRKNYLSGIIIIDELGREQKEINVWGTILRPMSQILQERYDNIHPTFATANFRLETLAGEQHYGKMVGDRLRQMFNTIELPGESRRH